MKKISILLLSFMIACAVNAQQSLPSVSLKTLEGKNIDIKDVAPKGKVTVLSFWATWCAPCKKELDFIKGVYSDWQSKYGMELVAISIDDARALVKVKPMVVEKGWKFTVLSDVNSDLKRALNVQSVPQTFIIDKNGKIAYSHSGYIPGDEHELEAKIKELSGK